MGSWSVRWGWASDPGGLAAGQLQHIVANVDGGPKVISYVINGRFHDIGDARQFGWGRLSPHLIRVDVLNDLQRGPSVRKLSLYDRYLRTAEAMASFRAGL